MFLARQLTCINGNVINVKFELFEKLRATIHILLRGRGFMQVPDTLIYYRMKKNVLTITATTTIAMPPIIASCFSISFTTIWKQPVAYNPLLDWGSLAQFG